MQRNGTTSVGDFFRYFQYPVARWQDSWDNNWSKLWYEGNFQAIFNSGEFKSFQVFEDDPWWLPEFYKVLYHRFPKAKFVLFYRDSEAWFNSMLTHSKGKTLGNTRRHCKIYRRELEFYNMWDSKIIDPTDNEIDNLLSLEGKKQHYKEIYEIRNREVIDFFDSTEDGKLFHCNLADANKWEKLGNFFGIAIPENFSMHANNSMDKQQS